MASETLEFLSTELPALAAQGLAALDEASKADPALVAALEDVRGARGGMHLRLTGEDGGELYLVTEDGRMRAEPALPEGVPLRILVEAPAEAARVALRDARREGALADPKTHRRLARLPSKRLEGLVEREKVAFDLIVKETPDFEEVKVRMGLGLASLPAAPAFTVIIKWEDLEAVRARRLTPQQVMMGRVRILGDAARAMALGMQLLPQPGKRPPSRP